MFRSQSSDHHHGSITVLVQLLLIGVHASSYSGMLSGMLITIHFILVLLVLYLALAQRQGNFPPKE